VVVIVGVFFGLAWLGLRIPSLFHIKVPEGEREIPMWFHSLWFVIGVAGRLVEGCYDSSRC